MIFEDSDFAHLTTLPLSKGGGAVGGPETPSNQPNTREDFSSSPTANLSSDIADYFQDGRIVLSQILDANTSATDVPESFITHKDPFAHNIIAYKTLAKEYGIDVRFTDNPIGSDGKPITRYLAVHVAPRDRDLLSSLSPKSRKEFFVRKMSNFAIHHTALDPITSEYNELIETMPIEPQPNLTTTELEQLRHELLIRGFMTSTLLHHLDFGQPDGVAEAETTDVYRKDTAAYEQLRKAGHRPFKPEEVWGMYEAEFRATLAADPELAAKLKARQRRTEQVAKTMKPKIEHDFGLDL